MRPEQRAAAHSAIDRIERAKNTIWNAATFTSRTQEQLRGIESDVALLRQLLAAVDASRAPAGAAAGPSERGLRISGEMTLDDLADLRDDLLVTVIASDLRASLRLAAAVPPAAAQPSGYISDDPDHSIQHKSSAAYASCAQAGGCKQEAAAAQPPAEPGVQPMPKRIWVEVGREMAVDGSHQIEGLEVVDGPDPDADYPYQERAEYVRVAAAQPPAERRWPSSREDYALHREAQAAHG